MLRCVQRLLVLARIVCTTSPSFPTLENYSGKGNKWPHGKTFDNTHGLTNTRHVSPELLCFLTTPIITNQTKL